MARFVIEHPIVRAIMATHKHQVAPLPGSRANLNDAAVAIAGRLTTEERGLWSMGMDEEEIYDAWSHGGHHDDRAKLGALAAKEDANTEPRATRLIAVYWDLVLVVADAVSSKSALDQRDLVRPDSSDEVHFEPDDKAVSGTSGLLERRSGL